VARLGVTAVSILIFSSATAMAGSPYNLTIPAPGAQFRPHVAKPSLNQNPVVNPSIGHARQLVHSFRKYTATTKARVRRQGVVSAGGASWNCRGNRCTTQTAWTRPTVQTCKSLASAVGAIQSYGKRGAMLNATDIRSCNAEIIAVRSTRMPVTNFNHRFAVGTQVPVMPPPVHGSAAPPHTPLSRPPMIGRTTLNMPASRQGGFAPATAPSAKGSTSGGKSPGGSPRHGGFAPASQLTPRGTISGGSGSSPSHASGGFAPAGLAGQVHVPNALSSEQLARISGFQEKWENYKRAFEEKRRQEEAALQARIRQLSHEAYISGADCNDNDPEVRPDLLEICDGKDNNCNEQIDEGVKMLKFFDADEDNHGDPARPVEVCPNESQRDGIHLSDMNNDCDDNDPDNWHTCPVAGSSR